MSGPGKPFSSIEALSSCTILHCYVSRLLHWHLNQDAFDPNQNDTEAQLLDLFLWVSVFWRNCDVSWKQTKIPFCVAVTSRLTTLGSVSPQARPKLSCVAGRLDCSRFYPLGEALHLSASGYGQWSLEPQWIPGENGPSADNYLITCRGRGVNNGHQACMPSDMCGLQHESWDLIRGCVGVQWPCKQEATQYVIKFDLWNKYCCRVSQAGVGISIDPWENWFLQNPKGGHWSQGHNLLMPGWSSFPISANNGGETESDSSWVCSLPEPRRLSFSVEVETPGS